jgi:hypothetical protein
LKEIQIMMMNRNVFRASFAFGAALALAACGSPPNESINTAEQAQETAEAAGAAEYAPEAYNAAVQAKAALDAEMTVQNERMALRRNYGRAEELATAYQTAAEQAATAAVEAKEQARQEATDLIAQTRSELDEVRSMLATAPVGKGTSADLAALRGDLETADTGLTEAETALTEERFLEARTKATTSRDLVAGVRSSIEMARGLRAS